MFRLSNRAATLPLPLFRMTIFQAWRTHKKMTQSEVAERMGIPQSNVSRIESGKTSPSFQTIKAYAKALYILPEQLDQPIN